MASRRERQLRRQEQPPGPIVPLRPRPLGDCEAEECRIPADRTVLLPGTGQEYAVCRVHGEAVQRQIERNELHAHREELLA